MAAGLLWILDSSINISMEPFRAFVADLLPEEQRTEGFAMQSLFIGLGAVVASALPWLLTNVFHLGAGSGHHAIPWSTRLSFYIGAAAFLGAVLWTIVTTKEYPPDDIEAFRRKKQSGGLVANIREIAQSIARDAADHAATGAGAIAHLAGTVLHVAVLPGGGGAQCFRGSRPDLAPVSERRGVGRHLLWRLFGGVLRLFAPFLARLAGKIGRKHTHSLCLLCGALGLLSVGIIHDQYLLILSMVGVGIAWASTLAMPYSILAGSLPPEKTGVYMGIFNFFIVLPEILASVCFGWVMNHVLHNNRLAAVIAGGVFMALAAVLMQRVVDPGAERVNRENKVIVNEFAV